MEFQWYASMTLSWKMEENNKQNYGGKASFLQERTSETNLIKFWREPVPLKSECIVNIIQHLGKKKDWSCKSNDSWQSQELSATVFHLVILIFFPPLSSLCIPLWLLESGTSLIQICDSPNLFYSLSNSLLCFYPLILTFPGAYGIPDIDISVLAEEWYFAA